MKFLILRFIRWYQMYLSVLLPGRCRFYPSCSEYAYASIEKFGLRKGLLRAIWRIIRCNPFTKGGYDPVV